MWSSTVSGIGWEPGAGREMAGFRAGDLDKYEWRYSESADGEATEEEGSFRGGVAGGSWIFSFLLPNGKRAMGKEEESCRKDYISNSFFFFFSR
ncbi:hypothetical protein QG37_06957 [Candidozyma auris]|uniref:Uncharacterized protein n=1 Tax=Candidozyma auris TaxID=498019 RepID=A0A0L0NRM1_CANAR|nr:hypothetical protein QG37_06957 [[Candida] auris]